MNTLDFITRFLENERAAVLVCDHQLTVIAVSERIKKDKIAIDPGQNLKEIFKGSFEWEAAFRKLSSGMPFYSTNFEFFPLDLTLFMLPVLEENELSTVLCCLCFPEENLSSHSAGSLLPLISDRYRSPISNILNIVSMLASKAQSSEDYKSLEYLNAAARNCYRMLRGTSALHEYYALVNGKADYKPQYQILSDFLSNLCQTLQVLFRNTLFRLVCDPGDFPIITCFDERLLSLALFHLISNSCIYSPADSTIRITLSQSGDTARITVSDEGVGIPAADLDRVFEPFYTRREIPVPEEEMGTGLGLPIVKKIAELHGGSVFITSEPNRGTTVALSLPIREPDSPRMTFHSDTVKYVTDRFSDMYLLFSDICDIKLY